MKILLASFDPVPAPKGASAHILKNLKILTAAGHRVSLLTLGDQPLPGIPHKVLQPPGKNWLERAVAFRTQVGEVLAQNPFDLVHVRSPFEGLAVPPDTPLIYEVNALYSIEMVSHFPDLIAHPGFRDRMRAAELLVLQRANHVITPSRVTAQYLGDLGCEEVFVVPNSPSIPASSRTYHQNSPLRLVYIGTLADWQGLHQALRCLSRLTHLPWTLSILSHTRRRKWVYKLIERLGLTARVSFEAPRTSVELGHYLRQCDIGLAPLTPGERNLVQGCMPVKLLDYMRAGLAILAPDLPVVTDIIGSEAPTYRPWSRTSLTQTLEALMVRDREPLGEQMRARVDDLFSESIQKRALLEVYS